MEQEHACLLLPATEPAAFLKLKVQVFPSPCGGQNKALDWLKLLPSNSEVLFKGGLSRKQAVFQLPPPKRATVPSDRISAGGIQRHETALVYLGKKWLFQWGQKIKAFRCSKIQPNSIQK
jgi:hypothetical protein